MDHGAPFKPAAAPRPLNGSARTPALALDPLTDDDEPGGDYDALRDLFLSGSALGPSPSEHRAPPVASTLALSGGDAVEAESPTADHSAPWPVAQAAEIEGLILGHLPVFGPAWAGQYARSLVDEVGGPVGLIGIRAGHTNVDVYGPGDAGLAACDTLDEAIASAAPVVARWLVRLDEVNEPQMAECARLARITLLTGVDETAVVACYRTLKRLIRRDDDGTPAAPIVRLAIMGAAPERAAPAAEKLSRAAETFLGRSVEAAACLSRISPGRSVSIYRGPSEVGLDGVLDLLTAAPRAPKTAVSRCVPAPAEPAPAAATPSRIVSPAPAPVQAPLPPVVAATPGASLCARIGLHPLAARCPHAPTVELAFDSSGVLHLLALAEEAAGQTTAEERAMAHLTASSAWAAAHLTLIALTAPEARLLPSGARPVLHLATRNAPAVRRLLDADVRVHLVATVEVEGRSGVVCMALN